MLRGRTAPLRQVHLSRLSPVMWTLETGYPRPELAVPIMSFAGGNYESVPSAPPAPPRAAQPPLTPQPMSGCGCGLGTNGEGRPSAWTLWPVFLGVGAYMAVSIIHGITRGHRND